VTVREAIKKRRSIRSYAEADVEDSKLTALLEAARQAPSASNRQEWRFVVVKDKATRLILAEAAKNQDFLAQAPVVIACCAVSDNHVMTCGQLCYPIDVAIAIDHIVLAAIELGLGTCWIGAFHEDRVKEILRIPEDIRVVELLALGYPRTLPSSLKNRLSLSDIAFFEHWPAGKR
jgi:nitroreductase